MEAKDSNRQWGYIAVILALMFAMSFLYVRFLQPKEWNVNGVKVVSARPPSEELPPLLAGTGALILREELYAGNDSRNAVVGVLGAQVASAFAANNRTLSIYGHVQGASAGADLVNCVSETHQCKDERIVVKMDACNCVRSEGGTLWVLYDEATAKMVGTRTAIAGLFNSILRAGG